jgi:succinate dehydrogenase / fumarate reductase, cytochrome b subunit
MAAKVVRFSFQIGWAQSCVAAAIRGGRNMPAMTKRRPKYLNLMQIRLPLPGFVSILHRVSGAVLFLWLPFLLYLFATSLESPDGFESAKELMAHPLVKLILLGLLWSYLHHFCAGIRYLFLDIDKGVDLQPARRSAWAVLAVSLPLTLVVGVMLLW